MFWTFACVVFGVVVFCFQFRIHAGGCVHCIRAALQASLIRFLGLICKSDRLQLVLPLVSAHLRLLCVAEFNRAEFWLNITLDRQLYIVI